MQLVTFINHFCLFEIFRYLLTIWVFFRTRLSNNLIWQNWSPCQVKCIDLMVTYKGLIIKHLIYNNYLQSLFINLEWFSYKDCIPIAYVESIFQMDRGQDRRKMRISISTQNYYQYRFILTQLVSLKSYIFSFIF